MHMQKNTIICLMGPTGAGKSRLAFELVERFPFEIISVDSAMVYRDMNIGTAKPTPEELKKAPHRLIDIRDPGERYSVGEFRYDALCEINSIFANKKIPFLVGGTMLYFKALQEGLSNLPGANPKIREEIVDQAKQLGWPALHKKLTQLDPTAAKRIHKNDSQRIQRALELVETSQQSVSSLYAKSPCEPLSYKTINIGLIPEDRAWLHRRIEQRFDAMLQEGFVDEVKKLYARGDLTNDFPSMRSVGYRQVWDYLDGKYDFDTMREKAIIATRQLAKRQLTWLRGWSNLHNLRAESASLFDDFLSQL
ncbi:MAG: tRNA (adenosine(37)-N6)-dimethylallyltransferase MiaA [Gammaproteobacteria bacterium RIFCSPHIGHO2_02_FULL_42_13]|nr:MAG: tRNA (adenosine(37)-N6)-dimethylallyltransferase MiaA [Gammaproteobacteria bacterium RIFCSPHIGHO2_02_FULL_42_13]OGT70593.1 MAG: tRNA (adenosine(37)-N6)-dimethylallyltransferase MiaA [Gammaproteobacteria bacterium RIFCSPLOWO2_02_FULL_42_9]